MIRLSTNVRAMRSRGYNTMYVKRSFHKGLSFLSASGDSLLSDSKITTDAEEETDKKVSSGDSGHDRRWKKTMDVLLDYVAQHGDADVPLSHPTLGRWIRLQRLQYRLHQDGQPSSLNEDRIQQLENVGFVWNRHELKWEQKYQELTEFYKQHGHSLLPNIRDSSLGVWMHSQRNQYRLFMDGKPSSMTETRISRLEALDFCWDAREALWQERYKELCHYCDMHGDCLVPKIYPSNPEFGLWVHTQRNQYKQWKKGEASCLTPERIELLESIGFIWSAHEAAWMRQYIQLVEHIQRYGGIPRGNKHSLTTWIRKQRMLYKKRLKGEKVPLTDERIARLNKIGFYWG